jgi:hypothetical protein
MGPDCEQYLPAKRGQDRPNRRSRAKATLAITRPDRVSATELEGRCDSATSVKKRVVEKDLLRHGDRERRFSRPARSPLDVATSSRAARSGLGYPACVAVAQHECVAIRIGEERHVADTRIDDVPGERDPALFELRTRRGDVFDVRWFALARNGAIPCAPDRRRSA